MCLGTWDKDGNRITVESTYEPYLYIETGQDNYDGTSIFNTRLRKKTFNTSWDRSQYLNNSKLTRIFENFNPTQQFLLDTFWNKNEDPEFTKYPLKIHFVDIEAVPEGDTFSDPADPRDPINVITTYDTLTKKYTVFGQSPYHKIAEDLTYIHCKTEKELLEKYLQFFEKDRPDVWSGYNSLGYDHPYIINRINRVLGDGQSNRLSPVGKLRSREFMGKYGRMQVKWYIEGISCIDYLEIYQRFCPVLRESYKLGVIGEIELEETKVDFGDTDLATLAAENWEVFVDYNIQDVRLLVKLEEKLQYIALLRMMAYFGLVTFEGALGSVGVFIGLCTCEARRRKQCIPTFVRHIEDETENAGGFVLEPQRGFQHHVVTYDANSLYPNTMISLNLSPETKVGKIIEKTDSEVVVKHENGQQFTLSHANFTEFVKREQISISKANILFSQKEKGIIPSFLDKIYQKRVEVKRKYKKLKKQSVEGVDNKTEMDRLDILQYTQKICLNMSFGVLNNKHNPMGDTELGDSITLTGQAVIKQSSIIITDYIKSRVSNPEEVGDYLVAADTDSNHFSLKYLATKLNISIIDKKGKITKEFHQLVDDIGEHLNAKIAEWGKTELNSADCRFEFKREKICDVAFYLQKKRYVLHVLDDEGIACDQYKYTGVEVVRTTMPKPIKPHVKRVIEVMLKTQSIDQTNKSFLEVYDIYKTLPIEDIALFMGIRGYDKYANQCEEFKTVKGMPRHVKCAYFYNMFVDKLGLQKTTEKINSGDKVRFFYVEQPNKFGLNSMGFKYGFPKEFAPLFKPDYELMFEKVIYEPINRFYEAAGWKLALPRNTPQTDLFQLLGM